ncbi:hypothetical protein Tco_0320544 [Tanacetum coccineum]
MNGIFNSQDDPNTRIEPVSDKESPEAEIDADMVIVNANKDEEESVGDEQKTQSDVAAMIVETIQKERENLRDEVISQVNDVVANHIPPQGESSAKRQKTSEHGTYLIGESPSGQTIEQEPNSSGSGTQEQLDEFDAWMEDVRTDDDEVPDDKESRKERLILPTSKKKAPVVHSCQRDLKAPPLTLMNQDLFYLKHGNLGPKKYTLSLHKFPAVPFHDDDMEERTSRWVNKRLNKFNVYAQYSVEHWKNMWAKQDHIRRQKQLSDNPHEIANGKIDPITEPDYKYLNKNDIEDMYLLCINDKVKDYRETGLLGSLVVFIRATIIWERVHDFQLGMESYQQKNNKKEKRVMVHKVIHKFYDATLKRVLEKLEKYNKDIKHGYADQSPSNDDAEYLRYYEEDIKDRLSIEIR